MSASNARNANFMALDALLLNKQVDFSMYIPQGWNVTANQCSDNISLSIQDHQGFGGTTTIQIPTNLCQYLGQVILQYEIDLGTTSGGVVPYTGTTASWVDYLTLYAIDYIEYAYASQIVQRLDWWEIYAMFWHQLMSEDQRIGFAEDLNGPLPLAVRTARMQINPQNQIIKCRMNLPLYWAHSTHQFQPQVLGTFGRIIIHWKPLANCRNSTGDGSFTYLTQPFIKNVQCRTEAIYTEQAEALYLSALHRTDQGITSLTKTVLSVIPPQLNPIPAGQSLTFDVKIEGPNLPCQTMAIWLRDAADVNTPDRVNPFNFRGWRDDLIEITNFEFVMTGGHVKTSLEASELIYNMNFNRVDEQLLRGPFYFIDFSKHASAIARTAGHVDFAGLPNPVLKITVRNNSAVQFNPHIQLLLWCDTINAIKGGTIQRLFQ